MIDFHDNLQGGPDDIPTKQTLAELKDALPGATPTGAWFVLEQIKRYTITQLEELARGREVTWERLGNAILGFTRDHGQDAKIEPNDVEIIIANAASGLSPKAWEDGTRMFPVLTHPQVGIFNTEVKQVTDANTGQRGREVHYLLKPNRDDPRSYTESMQKLQKMATTGKLPVDLPKPGK
ncbi:MAG: hypothetical protein KGJ07_03375 [Patescibacteria group bacterium]|nr:hypothetical protein [Patescibacteria group bacterium]